ncbi:MAG: 3-dehydroquinate synthase [Verrucomicrobia bacterium]|nr:3-dehydroquinate synthase [Verrucomicrobiota bacterium]MBI3870464.1 3-dehydroquinate synthase [Verrucomicrobiota bacterium]
MGFIVTTVIQRTIQVSYRHQVFFTRDVFARRNGLLRDVLLDGNPSVRRKVMVIVDEALSQAQPALIPAIESYFKLHGRYLDLVCSPVVIEGGERTKNSYFHVSEIQSLVDRYHVDRHSYILAIGGGALLDMAGLAAATAHRGVRHVRVPTTTLAQDDSGVGVKNGINAFGKKNFIGSFAPPFAVINDFELLRSCPARDKRAGYVEAVKVALIRDKVFFEWIEKSGAQLRRFAPTAMRYLIERCAELHVNHIATSGDPFEFGSARPLDFGHWAAHKLEQLSHYRLRHGEAVAIGIALDTVYSRRSQFIDGASCERILRLLEALGFELFTHELRSAESDGTFTVLRGLEEFREHLGGQLTITLLQGIGQGFEVHEMHMARVMESIAELADRQSRRVKPRRAGGEKGAVAPS